MGCVNSKKPININNLNNEDNSESKDIKNNNITNNKKNNNTKKKYSDSNNNNSMNYNQNNIEQNLNQISCKYSNIKINKLIPKNPTKIENNYKVICKLGKGSFGAVYKVIQISSGTIKAMKVIKKESINYQDDERVFLKEIEILKKIEHPSIIKIYEYYTDDVNFYIITEYVGGGELYDAIVKCKKFNEQKAAYIIKQILSALNYLHSYDIVHRDIKPENMLVEKNSKKTINKNNKNTEIIILNGNKKNDSIIDEDDDEFIKIKIIDFGTSNYIKDNKNLTLKVGSPYYIAPEVLKKNYNKKCDIWSAGIILYVMLIGKLPFHGKNTEELLNNISKGVYKKSGPEWEAISSNAKDLIINMLESNPEKRFSAQKCLDHPFILNLKTNKTNNISMAKVLKNISELNAREKLQQATIAYIVHNLNQTKEINDLQKVFQEMDVNNDGMLTYIEIKNAYEKYFGKTISEMQINKIIEGMDSNSDGIISYEEFLRVSLNQNHFVDEKNLKLAFDLFDLNKDGKLSKEELITVLDTSNFDYIDSLISIIDNNKDGFINFDEFKNLMELTEKRFVKPK